MSRKTAKWTLVMVLCLGMVVGFTLGAAASSYRLNAMGDMYGIVDDEIDALSNPALFADVEQLVGSIEFVNSDTSSKDEDLIAKTTTTTQSGSTSLDGYFAMPLGISGLKNTIAARLTYAPVYIHNVFPTYKYDSNHPNLAWGVYDGLRVGEPLAIGFGLNMTMPHKRVAKNTGTNTTYTEEWKYPINGLLAGSTYKMDEKTQISAQGSYTMSSGDYLYTSQVGSGSLSTITAKKDDLSDMQIQAKVKRELGGDLTGVGFIGFGSGATGVTPKGNTVINETKTSKLDFGAGVVKKFDSALVAAKATYTSNTYKYSDESIYVGTYKSKTEGDITVGVGAELTITKGLVARVGISDTFSSTTKVVRANDSKVKNSDSGIVAATLGLGYSFRNFQVDLLVPTFSTFGSEDAFAKTNTVSRTIQLGVSAKF